MDFAGRFMLGGISRTGVRRMINSPPLNVKTPHAPNIKDSRCGIL